MSDTITTKVLSYEGARKVLDAAIAKAKSMNVPQCITVVDAGGSVETGTSCGFTGTGSMSSASRALPQLSMPEHLK